MISYYRKRVRPHNTSHAAGFSLIQALIMVIVASIIIAAGFNQYITEMKLSKQAKTKQSVDIATSALTKYALKYGMYPLPAAPGAVFGANNFGRSVTKPGGGWPDCQNAGTSAAVVCRTTSNSFYNRGVLIGVLPAATLGLPFDWALDENNNVLTYAVTEALTESLIGDATAQNIKGTIQRANPTVIEYVGADSYKQGDFIYITGAQGMVEINDKPFEIASVNVGQKKITLKNVNSLTYGAHTPDTGQIKFYFDEDAGAVEVIEANDRSRYFIDINPHNDIDDKTNPRAHFAVISHGRDGRGAYAQNGAVTMACATDSNSDDFENCNRDGQFRRNSDATTDDPMYNFGSGTKYFDDLVSIMTSTSTNVWSITPTASLGSMGVRSRLGGNVAIGDCDNKNPCVPVSQLDVYGAVRVQGQVKAASYFGRGPGNQTSAYYAPDIYTNVKAGAGTNTRCPQSGQCPTATVNDWNSRNLPPFFTAGMIGGNPESIADTENPSGKYWISKDSNNGSFHRGNGIRCIENRAMKGVFAFDEACEDGNTLAASATANTRLGDCPTGSYPRGINAAGALVCKTPGENSP